MTGDVTIDNTGATTLANTAVTAGTYGNSTNVPQIVVDSKGRIIGASNVAISGASVTPSALTKTDDTNVTLTLGGTPSTALLQAVSLTLGWAGTLADSRIASASTWNNKQNALGYTPEDVANKATSLTSPDNTKYPTTQAVQTGLDLKANKSEVATVLFKSITPTIITGKTVETSIYSIPLPTDVGNYIILINSQAQLTTLVGAQPTHRLRVGIYNNPIDGVTGVNAIGNQTLLAQNTMSSVGNSYPITRKYSFYGGSSGSIFGIATNSLPTDEVNAISYITLASKDFTTQHYLYLSFNPSNVGAIVTHNQILVTAIKI